jgi:soluble lytic murein transglycosylase-like protein
MRSLLALTILILGINMAAPEWDAAPFGDQLRGAEDEAASAPFEIESSTFRSDRLNIAPERLSLAALQPHETSDQSPEEALEPAQEALPMGADIDPAGVPEVSIGDLCNALLTSAQDNDLPVAFFANLIWQESRLRDDAVSPVGALGIAQFMPQVAMASGLDNPFDPLQAIPASARLLRELRDQFGNLGFVAAAYNAGARRVSEWLEHRRTLPRETRDYVVRVTGRSAEDWRKTPPEDAALTFVHRLPCRGLPAYADLEQEQLQVTQWQKTEEKAEVQAAKAQAQPAPQQSAQKLPEQHAPAQAADRQAPDRQVSEHKAAERKIEDHKVADHKMAARNLARHRPRHDAIKSAARTIHDDKRQGERTVHEKSKSAHRIYRARSKLA